MSYIKKELQIYQLGLNCGSQNFLHLEAELGIHFDVGQHKKCHQINITVDEPPKKTQQTYKRQNYNCENNRKAWQDWVNCC